MVLTVTTKYLAKSKILKFEVGNYLNIVQEEDSRMS